MAYRPVAAPAVAAASSCDELSMSVAAREMYAPSTPARPPATMPTKAMECLPIIPPPDMPECGGVFAGVDRRTTLGITREPLIMIERKAQIRILD